MSWNKALSSLGETYTAAMGCCYSNNIMHTVKKRAKTTKESCESIGQCEKALSSHRGQNSNPHATVCVFEFQSSWETGLKPFFSLLETL